eukprot:gnl/MRDRNA2_/MRDRNA2_33599_c0_seq1.p1 gnl/MRDRNA2_/MRDRNA2_33599_c0~~gnl/MRDRNA2_/MRDRNA2_33599_c0_seq1.p1  ORF type:complete len:527 (+),score=126.05 gnl/MRDRNA2_/MRDRNA2_33599_c0_seq1:62-1642(+)
MEQVRPYQADQQPCETVSVSVVPASTASGENSNSHCDESPKIRTRSASKALEESLRQSKRNAKDRREVSIQKRHRKKVRQLLSDLDKDVDGFISLADLEEGLSGALESGLPQAVADLARLRCSQDYDQTLDLDEFMSVWVVDEPSLYQKHRRKFEILTALVFFALAPAVFIPCNPNDDGSHWSFWDAMYFAAVTVTTVGYGDLGPTNDGMKVFTILYILFGLAIVASVVTDFAESIVQRYEKKMEEFNQRLLEKMAATAKAAAAQADAAAQKTAGLAQKLDGNGPGVPGKVLEKLGASPVGKIGKMGKDQISKGISGMGVGMAELNNQIDREMVRKLWMSLWLFLSPVLLGTVFFKFNEEWSWLDAFYWSVVTCTTVGYGDMSLTKESSRAFSFFFILLGFAFVGAAIGNVGAIQMERELDAKKRKILGKTLSMDMLNEFDKDNNGVDRCEFVCAMLVQLGKVTEDDILPLLQKFDDLDADGSGLLTKEDLSVLRDRKRKERVITNRSVILDAWADSEEAMQVVPA